MTMIIILFLLSFRFIVMKIHLKMFKRLIKMLKLFDKHKLIVYIIDVVKKGKRFVST